MSFKKRHNLYDIFMPWTDVSADQTAVENECKPEEVFNMTKTDIAKRQLLSRTLTIKDNNKGSSLKTSKEPVFHLNFGNTVRSLWKQALTSQSKKPDGVKSPEQVCAAPSKWMDV